MADHSVAGSVDSNELAGMYHALLMNGGEKWIPTSVGLATIPFIVHPIDTGVHKLLDFAIRPYVKRAICSSKEAASLGLDMCEVTWDD